MNTNPERNNQIDIKRAKTHTKWDEFKMGVPSIIILPIAIYWSINRGNYGLMDNIDLVIHEAGHVFFSLFGKFIYTLGGSLMQLIIPLIIAGFFFRNSYRTGVQFALLWLGHNLINISVYVADARAQKLQLLGGNKVYHDWYYMLNEIGLVNFDHSLGYIIFGTAIAVFLISIFMPLITQD